MTRPIWLFSKPPANHAPSVPFIRLDLAFLSALVALVGVDVTLSAAQWWALPWSPQVPPGGLLSQIFAYPSVLLSYVAPHSHALVDNPAYDGRAVAALHARLAPALLVALVAAAWRFKAGLVPVSRTRHLAGPRLLQGADAKAELTRVSAEECHGERGFMHLGGVWLPKQRWTRGVLLYGSPGSGKTQAILPLVQQLIEQRHRALIYDVKSDFTSYFLGMNGTVSLFSPWDSRSLIWDIAADCRSASDAQILSSAIVPSDDGNPYFTNAAKSILEGVLISLQNELPRQWTWGELARRLASDRKTMAQRLEKHHPSAHALVSNDGEQADNVLSSVTSYCKPLFDLAAAWPTLHSTDGARLPSISFREWASDGYAGPHRQILLQAGPNAELNQAFYGAVLRLLTPRVLSPELPDDEHGRTLAFVLDELPSLGAIPFAELIERGRSKGVVFVGGCQTLDQIEEVWGSTTKNSLGSMIGTHIVGRLQPSQSRDTIAELMGKERVSILAVNSSGSGESSSIHEEWRSSVQPYQLTELLGPRTTKRSLEFPHGFYSRMLVAGLGPDLPMIDVPGVVLQQRRTPHRAAAWTTQPKNAGEHSPEMGTEQELLGRLADEARVAAPAAEAPDATVGHNGPLVDDASVGQVFDAPAEALESPDVVPAHHKIRRLDKREYLAAKNAAKRDVTAAPEA
ncbi:type IV secretion system DNA-binding domain-containing protein [Bacillus sp. NP157]|nr:type IV secretion system DNA-binding domain-containing protein [Bacillus sp. NP157]